MAMLSACLVAQPCLTFEALWTVVRQAPLPMGFSRQEHWRGCLPSREASHGSESSQGLTLLPPGSPALAGRLFTIGATWEALTHWAAREFAGVLAS